MRVYTDAMAELHAGDTVRYVCYDWATRGKFYNKTGTVTDIPRHCPGAAGVHFPHHAKGANIRAVAGSLRLVACPHEDRRYGNDD